MGRAKPTHRPNEHGPQIFRRGRYYAVDLRPWKAGRPTLRNPQDPGWPRSGEPTEFEDVARRWSWKYVNAQLDETHRKQTGRRGKGETFALAKERYLRHRERTSEWNTVQNDQTVLGHIEKHVGEGRDVHRITTEDLQTWFDARIEEGYGPGTLRTYRFALRAFFEFLAVPNPATDVELPRLTEKDARFWTDAELVILRRTASKLGTGYRTFLELALATGGRLCELKGLRYEDFDPQRKTVRFTRQAINEYSARTKGLKGKKNRTALVLPEWWPYWRAEPGPIVTVYKPMNMIRRESKIDAPGGLNHACRHAYSRMILEGGVSLEVLQKYLGHASIVTTQRTYGHLREEIAVQVGQRAFYGRRKKA